MRRRCIMIMAGGTGGHVFPALSLAKVLRDRDCEIVWLGTRTGIEARLVPASGFPIEWIAIGGLRGKGLATLASAPLRLLRALAQSIRAIRRHNPSVVVGLGGYVTGPGGLAAWLTRRPLVIHEQNAIAGLTNRVLARLATVVLEAFEGSFPLSCRARAIGNPVRDEFFAGVSPETRYASRSGPIRMLVVGGSQGAARLNAVVPEALAALRGRVSVYVRHQSGERGLETARARYTALGVEAEVVPFINDIAAEYAEADLVICRAGALTVSEIAAIGVAAIFVPFPAAVDDHQTRNAQALVERGAAVLMPESTLGASALAKTIERLAGDRQALADMARRAREIARPQATHELAAATLAAGGLA